jgi:hypothetical protein
MKAVNGLIQHSFGLQLSERGRPFLGRENSLRIAEHFDCETASGSAFHAFGVGETVSLKGDPRGAHSPLAERGFTTLNASKPIFVRPGVHCLPDALGWAGCACDGEKYEEPSLILADEYDPDSRPSVNDFLITEHALPKQREPISQLLLELMAHKRSRLFGFRLANRLVNVMLPHALLSPNTSGESGPAGTWFVQPLVSFVRGGRDRNRLRGTYSLTFFLIPIRKNLKSRRVPVCEIDQIVNAGWGFAASPVSKSTTFDVSGDLFDYLSVVARPESLDPQCPVYSSRDLTLRGIIERVAFGVGLLLAQGKTGTVDQATARRIGNDVVMSLGSARVSSVVVANPDLKACEVKRRVRDRALPGPLRSLMKELSDPIRTPEIEGKGSRKYRLDRPSVDDDIYATGVLPTKRCIIVMSRGDAQYGVRESALMQAGSIAYMTIGSSTAIATMRAIDRRLEHLDGAGPKGIAEIDREIAADLSEIYDLDITRESYREIYRRLRNSLGIARDYKTLQDKMQALYRATSTLHEVKTQARLVWLTGAIVLLSVLILVGTIVLAGKPGG